MKPKVKEFLAETIGLYINGSYVPSQRANDSDYGLAAGVWTKDIKKAHYVTSKLQAGTVWINDYGLELEAAPFGGYKQSGIGRELGSYALNEYTEVKSVYVNIKQT